MPETYKILHFMKKRPDLITEEFRKYYETRHAPLCERYSQSVQRYIRRYIEPGIGQADIGPGSRARRFSFPANRYFKRQSFEPLGNTAT